MPEILLKLSEDQKNRLRRIAADNSTSMAQAMRDLIDNASLSVAGMQVKVDFTGFPDLLEKIKYFAKREFLPIGPALLRIVAIAVDCKFNLGDECMDPWPFIDYPNDSKTGLFEDKK